MPKESITQERLKELLHYDPETGVFTRVISYGGAKAGNFAGCKMKTGYLSIRVLNKLLYAHRLAFLYMEGSFPKNHVDHINHNREDNRWVNLRHASNGENAKNISITNRNTSGCVGVTWNKIKNKWQAQIVVNGDYIGLGYYKNKDDAITARLSANTKYSFHPNHGASL